MPAQPPARSGQVDIVIAGGGPAGLITVITARCLTKPAPAAALLIRPDGRVAWAAGPGTPDPAAGMNTALRTWFSPRTPPQTRH